MDKYKDFFPPHHFGIHEGAFLGRQDQTPKPLPRRGAADEKEPWWLILSLNEVQIWKSSVVKYLKAITLREKKIP